MEISPDQLPWKSMYKLFIGSVLPRPIGWISTVNAEGQPNLAPYSFFNVASVNPPHVLFAPMIRSTDSTTKDTLNNVRHTEEFVVNIVTEDIAEAMNLTATELPADVDEFDFAGIEQAPSVAVKPPRVAASPIHFECKLAQIIEFDTEPGSGSLVIGRVVHVHVDERVQIGEDKIDLDALKPIGRLAGTSYTRVTDVFDLVRKPPRVEKK